MGTHHPKDATEDGQTRHTTTSEDRDPTESTPSPATHTPPPTPHATTRRPPTTRTLPPPAPDPAVLEPVREHSRRPSETLDQSPSVSVPQDLSDNSGGIFDDTSCSHS